uniref:Uncharacterized protein n=1 Tax=Balaenoptera musculus TaxID=9771 RepID=A0A8C0CZI7_BALMU
MAYSNLLRTNVDRLKKRDTESKSKKTCAPQQEAAMVRGPRTAMKSGPHLPQLEKVLAQKRRPNTAINK